MKKTVLVLCILFISGVTLAQSVRVVLLPDTQTYSHKFPGIFRMQTAWIAAKADSIDFAIHLGDITDHNTGEQWNVAKKAFALMDGKVPYAFVPGNHDMGVGTKLADVRNTDLFNTHLPYEKYSRFPSFGGAFEAGKMDNTWHRFSGGGHDWLVLCLEFGPRNKVIEWANTLISDHPRHKVMVVTHAYMYSDDQRMGADSTHKWLPERYGIGRDTGADAVNNGQKLWEKLIRHHKNIVFVFNGHVLNDGTGTLVSQGDKGNKVYQMLSNYQEGVTGSVQGGSGFLRIIDIDTAAGSIRVRTYSPYTDEYKEEPDQQFTFEGVKF